MYTNILIILINTNKPNTLVFFPGTLEYLHGVKEITGGVRYTLTSFWTFNKNYNINGYDSSTK